MSSVHSSTLQVPQAVNSPPIKPRNEQWDRAFEECKRRVKREDWELISKVDSKEELVDFVSGLERRYQSRKSTRFLLRCRKIIECLSPFMVAVDVFVQVNPAIGSIVWGGIRVILQLVASSDSIADIVSECWEKVCLRLPRYKKLLDLFPMAPSLERSLIDMYSRIIDFSVYIINYFRANPIKNWAKSLTGKFGNELTKRSTSISKQASEIDEEERIADHEANKTRYETIEKLLRARSDEFSEVKPVYHIPFSKNSAFVGREDELQDIQNALSTDGSSADHGQRAVVLHGLGGLGKTEIALAFAYQSLGKYQSVLWVAAETPQKLQTSFSEIGTKLNLQSQESSGDEIKVRDKVLRWLNTTGKSLIPQSTTWLMIFDNAPDESCSFLRAYWPNGRSGAVLVTTRNACLAREFSIPADFALGPIDEKSSVKILLRGLPEPSTPEEQKAARQICFRLGNLPLALSQMSGYIHESGCSLDSFLITYQDFENLPVLHKTSQPGSTTGYEHTIATVWAMTMSLLETRSVTALRTLSLLAFLDPDGFIISALEEASPKVTLPTDFQYLSTPFPLQQSIRPLKNHNLVTIDHLKGTIKIHRVLQDFTMMRLISDQKVVAFETAVQVLHYVFPTKARASIEGFEMVRKLGDQFYPHVLALLRRFDEQKINVKLSPELYMLIQNLFWYLWNRGLFQTAMPFRSIAADIYNRDRGTNLLNLASLTGAMGTIYRNSDNAARAVELFKEEIGYVEEAIAAGMIEAHDEKLAIAYEHMAVATQQLGNYEEAAEWHTKNLDILLKYYKEDQVNIALAYVNQSWSLWKMGKLDDASRTLEWVLQTAQTALECNPQDFQAARARNFGLRALGNVRWSQERWDEAFNIHKRAFEGQIQTFGDNHFETGVLCHRMGCHYERLMDSETSIEYFRAALIVFESTPVPMISHIVRTRYKLGTVLAQHGEVEEAGQFLALARAGREALTGKPGDVDDSIEYYDSMVPYWAW